MPALSIQPTMDCEPPGPDISAHARSKSATGPADYAESERSIRGFVDRCLENGAPPTLYVHPQVAHEHRALFLELEDRGVGHGLHLHPYKFNPDNRADLGAYTRERQRELIAEATAEWEDALGRHPRYFRPGVYSASDATLPVLEDLGYRGGSVSRPESVKPDAAAVWAGAPLDPHRGHDGFRLLPGDLDFVNAPITVDPTRPVEHNVESLYLSAIAEDPYNAGAESYDRAAILEHTVDRIAAQAPAHPALVGNTHNNMDFSDPGHPATAVLDSVFSTIDRVCADRDLEPVGETIGTFVERFD